MKIVHLPRRFTHSHWGGTETVVAQASRALARRGHCCEVHCPAIFEPRGPVEEDGIFVERYPYFYPYLHLSDAAKRRMDMSGGNLFSWSLLQGLMGRRDVDLIHLHTGKRLGGIGRTVARRRGIPYVVSLHGGTFDVPSSEKERHADARRGAWEWGRVLGAAVGSRRVLEDADAVLCVSEKEAELARTRLRNARVEYVPNGVNVEHFAQGNGARFRARHTIGADARVILLSGRIDPQKNQRWAVSLLPDLLREEPRAHLVMMGHVTDSFYRSALESDIAAAGAGKHVTLLAGLAPESEDLRDAYHAADLLWLPSLHEPFGIVVLEAWAASVAVVVNDVGGASRLVQHQRNGHVCAVNDRDAALRSIVALLRNSEERQALARAGRQEAGARYSWACVAAQLERIYSEVADARAHRQ